MRALKANLLQAVCQIAWPVEACRLTGQTLSPKDLAADAAAGI